MDRSTRLHEAGIYKAPSNNPMNFYSTRYSTTHSAPATASRGIAEEWPGSMLGPSKQSGFSKNLNKTSVLPNGADPDDHSQFASSYNQYFQKPETGGLRERAGSLRGALQASRGLGSGRGGTGFVRNNDVFAANEAPFETETSYGSSYRRRPNPHADYRARDIGGVFREKDANGYVRNNANVGSYRLIDDEERERFKSTYTENNNRVRDRSRPVVPIGPRGPVEETGFSRSIIENDALVGRGFSMRPSTAPEDMSRTAKELAQLKRQDPLQYQHVVGGSRVQSTYELAHSANRELGLHESMRGADARRNEAAVRPVAPTDYGRGDGYTGMYATANKRAVEYVEKQVAIDKEQMLARGMGGAPRSKESGFTTNYRPNSTGGQLPPYMRAREDYTQTSHMYGEGVREKFEAPVTRMADITRGTRRGAYVREHAPPPIDFGAGQYGSSAAMGATQRGMLHPTVEAIERVNQPPKIKNYGEGARFGSSGNFNRTGRMVASQF